MSTLVRHEENEYETATWSQLMDLANALRVRVRARIDLTEPLRVDEELPVYDPSTIY